MKTRDASPSRDRIFNTKMGHLAEKVDPCKGNLGLALLCSVEMALESRIESLFIHQVKIEQEKTYQTTNSRPLIVTRLIFQMLYALLGPYMLPNYTH